MREFRESLEFDRPLNVSVPCTGIDACTRSIHKMSLKFKPGNIYDLEAGYEEVLKAHYSEAGINPEEYKMHLGPEEGQYIYISIYPSAPQGAGSMNQNISRKLFQI